MACDKWEENVNEYIFKEVDNVYKKDDVYNEFRYWYITTFDSLNDRTIDYCPFCGSELDEEGCTQGRLTKETFDEVKELFNNWKRVPPVLFYDTEEELKELKKILGEDSFKYIKKPK